MAIGTRLRGSTFVELVVVIFLLAVFSALAFPVLFGSSKVAGALEASEASMRAALSLAAALPTLAEEVRPPYWIGPGSAFSREGNEWRADYFDGRQGSFLALRQDGASRLSLLTPDTSITIDGLQGLSVDWWEKDKKIVGFELSWNEGTTPMEFHAACGSFSL